MFTGIIAEIGSIASIDRGSQSARFTVNCSLANSDVQLGDSITVNGACLTVVERDAVCVVFDVVHETLLRTAFNELSVGDAVNLERSLAASGRFDGHIVQGHIDGTGTIASIREVDNSYYIYVSTRPHIARYIVRKGSICMDGISLTVADADDKTFSVSIIPYTWEHTNLHERRAGDLVNLETDIVGKYVEKMMGLDGPKSDIDARGMRLPEEQPMYPALSTLVD